MTSETVQLDPAGNNGTIGYSYDPAGNRQQRTSSITPVPAQSLSYDANDRLTSPGYGYDANGSTTTDPNGTYSYDALGRLTSATVNGITSTYVYDGDGDKVEDTSNGTTTNYLIDNTNLTGYSQVLETLTNGTLDKVYTYGLNRLSEDQFDGTNWNLSFYGYDGQGSVRYLMDGLGNVTDTYTYDAFGDLISSTGTTKNLFRYDGEQVDANTGFYNLRARWMNPGIGRFQTMDTYEGNQEDPSSLHKYLFASDNSENMIDPSGNDDINDIGAEEPMLFWPGPSGPVGPKVFLYIRSFAPWGVFGGAFRGDNRTFSTSTEPNVSSRIDDVIEYQSGTNKILYENAYSSGSHFLHFFKALAHPTLSAFFIGSVLFADSEAPDPFFGGLAPSIKLHLELNSSLDSNHNGVTFTGGLRGNAFPNAEVFVWIEHKPTSLITYDTGLEYVPTAGVWSPFIFLYGQDEQDMGTVNKDVRF